MNQVRPLLSMHCMLLGYNFEPRPNIHTLGTAGSVMYIALINRCMHSKTQFDEYEETRLTGPQV